VPAPAAPVADGEAPAAKRQAISVTDRVELLAAGLDDEKRGQLFETLTLFAGERKAAVDRAAQLERERADLAARYSATKDNSNSMARQLVQVLNDVYRQFTPAEALKTEEDHAAVATGLVDLAEKHPTAFQHLNKMTVACSKIMERERESHQALHEKKQQEMLAVKKYADDMRSRFLGMEAQPDSPWMEMPSLLHQNAARVATPAPPVAVAASVHGVQAPHQPPAAHQQQRSVVPDWLRSQIGDFGAGGCGRLSREDIYTRGSGGR
jgi:hypothetical protein